MVLKINWNKCLFFSCVKKRKSELIGHDVFANCRFSGKFVIVDGICISLKSGKHFLLTSSMTIKKRGETTFFVNFPIYLSGALNFKVTGITYGFKVNCAKLVESRLK
jgi:hypothetical protein